MSRRLPQLTQKNNHARRRQKQASLEESSIRNHDSEQQAPSARGTRKLPTLPSKTNKRTSVNAIRMTSNEKNQVDGIKHVQKESTVGEVLLSADDLPQRPSKISGRSKAIQTLLKLEQHYLSGLNTILDEFSPVLSFYLSKDHHALLFSASLRHIRTCHEILTGILEQRVLQQSNASNLDAVVVGDLIQRLNDVPCDEKPDLSGFHHVYCTYVSGFSRQKAILRTITAGSDTLDINTSLQARSPELQLMASAETPGLDSLLKLPVLHPQHMLSCFNEIAANSDESHPDALYLPKCQEELNLLVSTIENLTSTSRPSLSFHSSMSSCLTAESLTNLRDTSSTSSLDGLSQHSGGRLSRQNSSLSSKSNLTTSSQPSASQSGFISGPVGFQHVSHLDPQSAFLFGKPSQLAKEILTSSDASSSPDNEASHVLRRTKSRGSALNQSPQRRNRRRFSLFSSWRSNSRSSISSSDADEDHKVEISQPLNFQHVTHVNNLQDATQVGSSQHKTKTNREPDKVEEEMV